MGLDFTCIMMVLAVLAIMAVSIYFVIDFRMERRKAKNESDAFWRKLADGRNNEMIFRASSFADIHSFNYTDDGRITIDFDPGRVRYNSLKGIRLKYEVIYRRDGGKVMFFYTKADVLYLGKPVEIAFNMDKLGKGAEILAVEMVDIEELA